MTARAPSPSFTVVVCCLGVLIIGINSTAIMTALPAIRRNLGLAEADIVWVVNAYLLAAATGVMAGGAASNRFGATRVTTTGFLLFTVASVVIALAATTPWLLVGRALQGVGAALAVPGTLAAVSAASRPEARAAAIGAWAGCLLLGFSLGPLIGGVLTHLLTWRAIFGIDGVALLTGAACLLTTRQVIPGSSKESFDAPGLLLLATAMVAAILALQSLTEIGRDTSVPIAWLALAIVSLVLLRRHERAYTHPLINPALLATCDFLPAVLVGATAMFCILPLLMTFNLHVQDAKGLGRTPVEAGLALLPMSVSLIGFALWAPRLIQVFGFRRAVAAGLLMVLLAGTLIAVTAERGTLILLCAELSLAGAGLALPYATAPRLALATVPPALAGQASGFLNACTLLAGSAGVTLCGLAYHRDGLPLAMGVVTMAILVGLVASRRLPPTDSARSFEAPPVPTVGQQHRPEALP